MKGLSPAFGRLAWGRSTEEIESLMDKQQPKYQHDCDECQFVGQIRGWRGSLIDCYVHCKPHTRKVDVFVVRYGPDSPESGEWACDTSEPTESFPAGHPFEKCKEFALEQNFYWEGSR